MGSTEGSPDLYNSNYERTSSKAYTIGGVPILFPYRAYPSQITMMDKIVKCLNKKFNCLLESPTGSGKSLALLCACLAWQRKIKKELVELEEKLERELNAYGVNIPDDCATKNDFNIIKKDICPPKKEQICNVDCCNDKSAMETKFKTLMSKWKFQPKENLKGGIIYIDSPPSESKTIEPSSENSKKACVMYIDSPSLVIKTESQSECFDKESPKRGIIEIEDYKDFQPVKKYRSSMNSPGGPVLHDNFLENLTPQKETFTTIKVKHEPDLSSSQNTPYGSEKPDKEKIADSSLPTKLPKIYYGTRTHKQVEQIIRELKKTLYKDSNMTILSSRERTCIHPEASRADNKNEACDELLKAEGGPSCKFYKMAKTMSHFHAKLNTAFDLEDFVGICKRARACPYYSSRELLSASDIVFCPYNYIIDPLIRSAMCISLKNSIVILDEAHNIEDSARDAASSVFPLSQIEASIFNLERVGRNNKTISDCYLYIAKILTSIKTWLNANIHNLSDYPTFNSSCKVWTGDNMIAILNYVELGPSFFPDFKSKFEKILAEENDTEKEDPIDMDEPKLLGSTTMLLKNLNQTLIYLYKDNLVFVPDYRCVVMKSKISPSGRPRVLTQNPFEVTLNFWCLNPSVAFSDIKGETHTVIVASGTLSPMASFQSELGIPFQLTLEANHVISKSQVWVGTIGRSNNNNSLTATYHNAATFTFQDDIGSLVLQVCCTIPHGVLCFLPSYSMLDNLVNRWQQTGMWGKLLSRKVVICEPRKQIHFVQVMSEFYEAIKVSESSPKNKMNGALFLAVCRGKVSEGLDFADNNARAVITIGIPFPSFKDAQVDLKRKYNDMYSSKRQIMSGSDWYETQAFRALNQALGRCIRHSSDFGALIIVDDRFQKNIRYPNALSKWIRNEIVHFQTFIDAMTSLNDFADRTGLKKND